MRVKKHICMLFVLLLIVSCGIPSQTVTPVSVQQLPATALIGEPTISLPEWTDGDQGVRWAQISFDELAPAGIDMQQCWNGMGIDDQGRIYIGFTSVRSDGREDFPVFRYDPHTGEKVSLGTFLDIVAAAGNYKPGESIPKGHTRMIFAGGKMYMGSQSFHDLKWEIDSLPTYRGVIFWPSTRLAPHGPTWAHLCPAEL